MRAAFNEGAAMFVATVGDVADEQWERPGLGEWTVRELTAHTLRAFTTIETYLAAEPATDRIIVDATEYFVVVLGRPGISREVAARGHAAGAALSDPLGEAEATAARVTALVASTLDDEPVNSAFGQMSFTEYLVTRCVELGVHTLDLQRAIGRRPHLHPDTAAVALAALVGLSDPAALLRALTGRQSLPADFNVLGGP